MTLQASSEYKIWFEQLDYTERWVTFEPITVLPCSRLEMEVDVEVFELKKQLIELQYRLESQPGQEEGRQDI